MKTVGIIGGIGPESTVEYYRFIVEGYRKRIADGSYPSIIIDSIDMKRMLDGIAGGRLGETIEFLSAEVDRISRAGADFGLFASNTPHIVFNQLKDRSPIPLISIVEAACRAASDAQLRNVALFGTRFTMQGGFYNEVFGRAGIKVSLPSAAEQEYIHEKYMKELVNGIVMAETKAALVDIASRMRDENGIDGLVLGGTELPMILRDATEIGVPTLDTTKIHAAEIVQTMTTET